MHKEPQSIIQMSEKGNMAAVKKGSKYDVHTYVQFSKSKESKNSYIS